MSAAGFHGSFFPVIRDGSMWLVTQLDVAGGPGVVLGRWTTLAAAETEAKYWAKLEAEEASK